MVQPVLTLAHPSFCFSYVPILFSSQVPSEALDGSTFHCCPTVTHLESVLNINTRQPQVPDLFTALALRVGMHVHWWHTDITHALERAAAHQHPVLAAGALPPVIALGWAQGPQSHTPMLQANGLLYWVSSVNDQLQAPHPLS